MDNIVGNSGAAQFANGQSGRDLRDIVEDLPQRSDSSDHIESDHLEALRSDSDQVLEGPDLVTNLLGSIVFALLRSQKELAFSTDFTA